jgi:mono/diheme cytochrome c family protein
MSSRNSPAPFKLSLGLLLAGLATGTQALAQPRNFQRGQELFEHHCQACHYDFNRADTRHVRSLEELRQKIEGWAVHTNAGWRKGEVDDVLFYLNKSFYRFEQKAM